MMGLKRISSASGIIPTTTARGGGRATNTARRRHHDVQKCSNLKLTILCGVITVLVFRGTIGVSYFSSLPENRILKEEANRIVAEIRSGDYDNDSESRITSNGTYAFGPKIINWDISRKNWLKKRPGFPNQVNGKPRILLVTGSQPGPCNNPIGDHYLLKAIKNKIDYCRMHDIEIVYNMAELDDELSGCWTKLPLIRRIILSHPEVEWVWWMDSDTFLTDMFFKLPISKYEGYNMVVHGYPNLLFDEHSWIALSTGSFLLRNCQWSLDLLDLWAPMGAKGRAREETGKILTQNLKARPEFEADDQSALIYLLISRKDELMDKVFLENSYYLHGFWVGLVDRYEEFMEKYKSGSGDERWPFVTHFVGCKICGGYGNYKLKRCVKSMERAFNFADNQVLKLYGFSHRGVLSPNIKMIRNETSRPLGVRDHVEMET